MLIFRNPDENKIRIKVNDETLQVYRYVYLGTDIYEKAKLCKGMGKGATLLKKILIRWPSFFHLGN